MPKTISIMKRFQYTDKLGHITQYLIEKIVVAVEQIRITDIRASKGPGQATIVLSPHTNSPKIAQRSSWHVEDGRTPLETHG